MQLSGAAVNTVRGQVQLSILSLEGQVQLSILVPTGPGAAVNTVEGQVQLHTVVQVQLSYWFALTAAPGPVL